MTGNAGRRYHELLQGGAVDRARQEGDRGVEQFGDACAAMDFGEPDVVVVEAPAGPAGATASHWRHRIAR
ncbi:hypothetical protein HGA13_20845 [Nocardia speluncae]|uniref:Uncharacterized protein n=1 Tax=Nocardia speluncae TaxID=419477 RepID=A0A846XH71_9NOCA|nr:hypothetical protein [Nocardia speluncae]NKY35498.1 hypothetical protein [Nocardia speluncae]